MIDKTNGTGMEMEHENRHGAGCEAGRASAHDSEDA